MTTSRFTVSGMTCAHCVASVTEEVEAMGGEPPPGYSSGGMRTKLVAARIATQAGLVHADEPLRRGAEDQRRLVPPAVRVTVRDGGLVQQRTARFQRGQNRLLGLAHVLAGDQRCVGQEHAVAAEVAAAK